MRQLRGVGGVPLGDAGVEVPAVEVDALVVFGEFGEEFARARQGFAFEMDEADDDIGNLNAGVVDVVLHADFVAALVASGRSRRWKVSPRMALRRWPMWAALLGLMLVCSTRRKPGPPMSAC